jgi:hypothetical protein
MMGIELFHVGTADWLSWQSAMGKWAAHAGSMLASGARDKPAPKDYV